MTTIIRTERKNRRSKRRNSEINQPRLDNPILITSVDKAGSVLTLTFNQAVLLEGTPGITTDIAGPTPLSATQPAPNQVEITFSAAIAAATMLNIPFRDPAIRNENGGYVISHLFPV